MVRLGQVRFGLVRLGHVGQVKVSCKKIVYVGSYYQLYDLVPTQIFGSSAGSTAEGAGDLGRAPVAH